MLIMCETKELTDKIVEELLVVYELSDKGEIKDFLKFEIKQNENSLTITQPNYITEK